MSAPRAGRIAAAYLRTRLNAVRLRDRGALAAHQDRLWRRMSPALAQTPALADHAGRELAAFPVRPATDLRGDLAAWNSLGLAEADILAAAAAAERGEDGGLGAQVHAGFSTGSSGRRGVFLTTPAERDDYLGTLLGKLLPPARLARRLRVALILRANNRLYADVAGAGAAFLFLGLDAGARAQLDALAAFAPTHVIAPPHILAEIARTDPEAAAALKLQGLYDGAEPMGLLERDSLAATFGVTPAPLYQATEGFLGAPCRLGTLHLNEDSLIVERDPVPGSTRFVPIVTDLRRRAQPVVRVRLDDLIEPLGPCACGSPCLAVAPVEGRVEDVWRFDGVQLFPREVEQALEAALPPLVRWRAQASPAGVRLWVEDVALQSPARDALAALLLSRHVARPVTADLDGPTPSPKRRRVRWAP
jgi:putative adenylate-forming enzyme